MRFLLLPIGLLSAAPAHAADAFQLGLADRPVGWLGLFVFAVAYLFVVLEERLGLRKSKPVMLGAALIWALLAWSVGTTGAGPPIVADAFERIFLEFAELFFFLVVAMTYVNAMSERNVFEALRAALTRRSFGYRRLFWATGALAFCLSPLLDNLTTSLIMSAVILALGAGNTRFIRIAFVNLVVAANAGGAWCAFGDITTLMVWQADKVGFFEFFRLIVPALVAWLVPAAIMHFAVPRGRPPPITDGAAIRHGGLGICLLFALTIFLTIASRQWLGMPPVFGMMTGLALLNVYAFHIGRRQQRYALVAGVAMEPYSIFRIIANAEWDTLLFFYGVLLCVGGLAAMGWLELVSRTLYGDLGPTIANVAMGTLSAVIDNIPIMFAVLEMNPVMDHGQWLLITLTAGIGGSLLSVGSAAGVALMGVSRGQYTFLGHLRWIWAIALGYLLSIATHLAINATQFSNGIRG
ncbi:MAG TPA: sodium:proton antiporter NhaD [Rhodanobacteraceae bacterium]|nr:sodium:proton antiporter NhaD [Rhodanobacteraceae bacterium]